jgi:hypothetical protein
MPDAHIPKYERLRAIALKSGGLLDRLVDMPTISPKRDDQSSATTLIARVRDQAELVRVLNSIYELHLPILLMEHLNEDNGE